MKRKLTAGQTSVSLPIFIQDTSSTTGGGLSGVTHASSGLVIEYRRRGQSSWTTSTPVAKTLGTFTAWGIVADGSLAGAYEVDLPDAAFAVGARWVVIRIRGVANMLPCLIEIELDALDYQVATQPVNVVQISGQTASASGSVTFPNATLASTTNISGGTIENLTNLPSIPNNWLTAAGIAAGALVGKGDWNTVTPPTAAAIRSEIDSNSAQLATIVSLLGSLIGYVDTEISSIKAKTDNLPIDPASASVIAASLAAISTVLNTAAASAATAAAEIGKVPRKATAIAAGAAATKTNTSVTPNQQLTEVIT